ncbi:MAG: hypothetical protein ABUM51_02345 [Bacteroidota bacterium]
MPLNLNLAAYLALCLMGLSAGTACAQKHDTLPGSFHAEVMLSDVSPNYTPPGHRLDQQFIYGQWDLLMNPIYITQISGKYKLNGKPLNITPRPQFYSLMPGQNGLLGSTITDEAGCYYFSFRMPWFEKSSIGFLHNTRLIFGFTHDKLQTGSDEVYYKYTDGGTEATLMLDKNLTPNISALNYNRLRLIFSWNAQAGVFASVAKIRTHMIWQGDTILAVNDNRYQLPNPRSGWGGIVASNVEVGVPLCYRFLFCQSFTNTFVGKKLFWFFRRIGLTVGARVMVEYLHSGTDVTVNGKSGYHLTANNFAASFSGPIIGLKIIDKL